jgi:hypothetical protein
MDAIQFAAVAQSLLDVFAPAVQTWFILFVGLTILASVILFIFYLIRPRISLL